MHRECSNAYTVCKGSSKKDFPRFLFGRNGQYLAADDKVSERGNAEPKLHKTGNLRKSSPSLAQATLSRLPVAQLALARPRKRPQRSRPRSPRTDVSTRPRSTTFRHSQECPLCRSARRATRGWYLAVKTKATTNTVLTPICDHADRHTPRERRQRAGVASVRRAPRPRPRCSPVSEREAASAGGPCHGLILD